MNRTDEIVTLILEQLVPEKGLGVGVDSYEEAKAVAAALSKHGVRALAKMGYKGPRLGALKATPYVDIPARRLRRAK